MTEHVAVESAKSTGAIVPAIARPGFILVGALVIGFLVEALLHGQPIGVGYAVAALVVVAGWLILGRGLELRPSRSALVMLAALAIISVMAAWRASPALRAVDVLVGLGLVLLIAAIYLRGRLPGLSLTDYGMALVLGGIAALIQPFVLLFSDLPKARRAPKADRHRRQQLAPVVAGLLLALPLLLVFGALFASADPVFAAYLRQLFDWDINFADLIGRLVLSVMLSWTTLGLARHAFTDDSAAEKVLQVGRPDWLRIGGVEAITVLALLNALFVSFVAVQAVYLFGGADTLARTGLTYSEYARRGFFELVTVAALVLSLILLADWLAQPAPPRARRVISSLHGLLVLLTLAILASALQRMRLYQAEYGLTELRLYTTAFMCWLAAVLIWLVITALARPAHPASEDLGRRRFAFGAFVAGLVVVIGLNLLNPDALIARTNLARAAAGVGQPLDAAYLTQTLSADAAPTLVAGLAGITDADARAQLACGLQVQAERLQRQAARLSWRGTTWGGVAARRALTAAEADLAHGAERCSLWFSQGRSD